MEEERHFCNELDDLISDAIEKAEGMSPEGVLEILGSLSSAQYRLNTMFTNGMKEIMK